MIKAWVNTGADVWTPTPQDTKENILRKQAGGEAFGGPMVPSARRPVLKRPFTSTTVASSSSYLITPPHLHVRTPFLGIYPQTEPCEERRAEVAHSHARGGLATCTDLRRLQGVQQQHADLFAPHPPSPTHPSWGNDGLINGDTPLAAERGAH